MGAIRHLDGRRAGQAPAAAAEARWKLLAERAERVADELDAAVLAALAQGRYRRGLATLASEVQGLQIAISRAVSQQHAVAAIYGAGYRDGFGAATGRPSRSRPATREQIAAVERAREWLRVAGDGDGDGEPGGTE